MKAAIVHDSGAPHDRSAARDATNRQLFALRRAEQHAFAEEFELERRLGRFECRLEEVAQSIDEAFRREHWGREPPRRLARAVGGG